MRKITNREDAIWNILYQKMLRRHIRKGFTTKPISMKRFQFLSQQNCTYCGAPPHRIIKDNAKKKKIISDSVIVVNGIDRKNSGKGYTIANCVPCCENCNYAKAEQSVAEFSEWLKRVAKFWEGKL